MRKKILSVFLTAAMLASLASCGGSEQQTTAATSAPATAATSQEETTPAANEEPGTEAAPDNGGTDVNAKEFCQRLANAAMTASAVSEIAHMEVEDEEMLTEVQGYDLSLFSDYCVITHIMSAHLIEVVVVKPAAGKAADVKAMLETRKEKIKTDVAFYPEQQENAEKTIVGSINNDEYIYMICGNDPPEMEKKMLEAAK